MTPLVSLNPKWHGLLRPNSGEGLSLDCPKCGPSHRLVVYFSNPIDGKNAAPWQEPVWLRTWLRTGEDLVSLTVEPSLEYPCFHGWIENGQVIDVSESPATALMIIKGVQKRVALSPKQFQDFRSKGRI